MRIPEEARVNKEPAPKPVLMVELRTRQFAGSAQAVSDVPAGTSTC